MEKYTLDEIEKIYKQCGVNPECKDKEDVKMTAIPNLLITQQTLSCNTNKTEINRKIG